MKNLVLITLVLCSVTITAQPRKHHRENAKKELAHKAKDWTPEQHATLATKKMTLALDLTAVQQKQVYPILQKVANNRKELRALKKNKTERTSDDLYNIKREQLDKRIETKSAMKNILSPEQFKKWETKHRKGNRPHRKSIQRK